MTCHEGGLWEQRSGQSGCAGSYLARSQTGLLWEQEELGEANDHVAGRREQVQVAGRRSQSQVTVGQAQAAVVKLE